MALARGRAHPLQGRGVGLDAERRAAPAGVGRPAGSAPGYAARALRDLIRLLLTQVPAVCLFVRAENTPRSGCTRRSGWSTCSTTGACSSEAPPARPSRARPLERRRPRQLRPAGRGAVRAGRRGGARAARGARRPRRSTSASRPGSCGRRRRSSSPSARAGRRGSCSPRSTRSTSAAFEGGPLEDYRAWAWSTSPTPSARAGARAGPRRRCGSPTRSTPCSSARRTSSSRSPTRSRSATSSTPRTAPSRPRAISRFRTPCRARAPADAEARAETTLARVGCPHHASSDAPPRRLSRDGTLRAVDVA